MKILKPILLVLYIILLIISTIIGYLGRVLIIISLVLKGDFYGLKKFKRSNANNNIK
jgi:hypothetical protein